MANISSRGASLIGGVGLLGLAIIGYVVLAYSGDADGEKARGLLLYVIPIVQFLFQHAGTRQQIDETTERVKRELPDAITGHTEGGR